ncbi:MAG: OmpA family protein, partial [Amaricoccus sp.]|uniref:OmpA family protein n=1 Tax=Amaricoccus sp. TaxID=1872485 RepID=UPI0033156F6A
AEGATEAPTTQHWTLPRSEQVNYQVKFAFDSAALSPDQKPRLRQVCAVLKDTDIQRFRIIGHTDASGAADYNQKLSILRAEEVERFFVNDCGIAAGRLEAIGVGEQFPYDDKDPGAAINRRVEFQALS